ncbi:patatin-like phospholipase family protein [Acanthopleuribacter pedis]|uniref:Patatin-like phospholipase family protein n=1 Tax=Acanthopleuribacter pedis TaxID=442870 RepID=A0A8J7QIE6_9BACT|nr:patatin-like phospholipase family protein [Acanthopleuribacter pedis]MBO1321296.1 patatin-like phospholipase family protein [Acanthopleuribacter pedis]
MRMRILLLLCLLPAPGTLHAQQHQAPANDPGRPTIGLALSGGGAKGLAHIGVLKMLEAMDIPIDYIAGTSMGAVVGGLYASGLSASELEACLTGIDWSDALVDTPNRLVLNFRRKRDKERYVLDLQMGIQNGKLSTPQGFRSGHKLTMELLARTMGVAHHPHFDDLPIPFRAVATDIEEGSMVVIDRGAPAHAIRASAAIPGVLAPVMLDGCLLVDGGMTRNLPIDIVRNMGADIVIAVDISDPLVSRDQLNSFLSVTNQAVGMLSRLNVEEVLGQADFLITPPIDGIGLLDFISLSETVRRGTLIPQHTLEQLEDLSVTPQAWRAWRDQVQSKRLSAPILTQITIEGLDTVHHRFIENRIGLEIGQPIDVDILMANLLAIHGLGDFEDVRFRVEYLDLPPDPSTPPQAVLVLSLREKSWGPNYFHFGFNMGGDLRDNDLFGLLLNTTMTRINRLGAEWRNDVELGRVNRIFTEFYQPLNYRGPLFAAPSIEFGTRTVPFLIGDETLTDVDIDLFRAGIALGYQMGTWGEFRVGIDRGEVRTDLETDLVTDIITDSGLFDLNDANFEVGQWTAALELDRLDKTNFPHRGTSLTLLYQDTRESLGADDDYRKLEGSLDMFSTRGNHTFFGSMNLGHNLNSTLPNYDLLAAGGLLSFSGYRTDQLSGQLLGVARFGYYNRFRSLPAALGRGVYLGGWIESGNVWDTREQIRLDNLRHAITFIIGADTILGPVYLAYGQAEQDRNSLYLSLGTQF